MKWDLGYCPVFKRNETLLVAECPQCDGYARQNDYGYYCYNHGTIDRECVNIREATPSECEGYHWDQKVKEIRDSETVASKLISWYGFQMPADPSCTKGNFMPGGYLHYEVYLSFMNAFHPNETPMPEDVFDTILTSIWR